MDANIVEELFEKLSPADQFAFLKQWEGALTVAQDLGVPLDTVKLHDSKVLAKGFYLIGLYQGRS